MDHNPDERLSFGIEDHVKETMAEIVDAENYQSRSHFIRSLIYDAVDEFEGTDEPSDDEHVPNDEKRRAIYRAALAESDKRLRVKEHHISEMAQATQFDSDSIEAILNLLRREGFVSMVGVPADAVDPDPVFRAKPAPVDPDDWTHREEPRDSEVADEHLTHDGAECIGHHFTSDGDACLKCGTPRDDVQERDTCERCGSEAFVEEIENGLCPRCRPEPVAVDGGGSA
jgi:Arc/MetJ-type ribon-helix-helix transcriptional regulator